MQGYMRVFKGVQTIPKGTKGCVKGMKGLLRAHEDCVSKLSRVYNGMS